MSASAGCRASWGTTMPVICTFLPTTGPGSPSTSSLLQFSKVWGALVNKTKFFIDKFHIANHTDEWCKVHMSPHRADLGDEFLGAKINTMICEQTFRCVCDDSPTRIRG